MAGNDPFCTEYKRWKSEGAILLENKGAYSRISLTPAVPGHYIVVPKMHVESPLQLTHDDNHDLSRLIYDSFDEIQRIYGSDVEVEKKIVDFYRALKADPPKFCEGIDKLAQRMLDHPHLRARPEGFNLAANVGRSAGQSVGTHFHYHVFPRRDDGKNAGIVTIVRESL